MRIMNLKVAAWRGVAGDGIVGGFVVWEGGGVYGKL